MSDYFDIVGTIERHRRDWCNRYHTFRSWEHCYHFFGRRPIDRELACLHLAAYLANFGMYRGSSFLSTMEYRAHERAVKELDDYSDCLRSVTLLNLEGRLDAVFSLKSRLKDSYATEINTRAATDVLITKIMMGALGCVPAFDRYLCIGLKECGLPQSFSKKKYCEVLKFCKDELGDFEKAQRSLTQNGGVDYPLMRVVDIYFWQLGFEAAGRIEPGRSTPPSPPATS
ncbi:MAG: hypothetical protein WBA29_09890 [Xanthobacteraceae bacterium]